MTKGAFFRHFTSKEDLAVAVTGYRGDRVDREFESAPCQQPVDPVERALGYIDWRRTLLKIELADYTCLPGTLVQEAYDTHPRIREACDLISADRQRSWLPTSKRR